MATDETIQIEATSGQGAAPLTGALMERYLRTYQALWGAPYPGSGAVTRDDLDHLSDLLEASMGRGDAVGFR